MCSFIMEQTFAFDNNDIQFPFAINEKISKRNGRSVSKYYICVREVVDIKPQQGTLIRWHTRH